MTSTGVTDGIRYTQHVYGRFGQGKLAMLPYRTDAQYARKSDGTDLKDIHTNPACDNVPVVGGSGQTRTEYWPHAPTYAATGTATVASNTGNGAANELTSKTDVAKIPYAYSEQSTTDRDALVHGIMISIFPEAHGGTSPSDLLSGTETTTSEAKRI